MLSTFIALLPVMREAYDALSPADQAEAKSMLADLMAENDEARARRKRKLAEAAKR